MSDQDTGGAAVVAKITGPNREATREDAITLAKVWHRLTIASKNAKTAERNLRMVLAAAGASPSSVEKANADFTEYTGKLASELVEVRATIDGLPSGTTAPGGANRQTVVLEFYGDVNRELKLRIGRTEARKINKAAFGG